MAASILEQHASEAAFLWTLREGAAGDPHYDLADLARLDERVEANLDGLRIGGDDAWRICQRGLAVEEPGELFVAAVIAAERGDLRGIASILDVGGEDPELQRGIVGGLAWLPFEILGGILPGLLDPACPAPLHTLGIAACASHRRDPGVPLDHAIYSEEPQLRARAMLAVGELGRNSLLGALSRELSAEDAGCRFAAAWSLGLAGEPDSLPVLYEIARGGGRQARAAAAVALRRAQARAAGEWVRGLARAETYRLAILGAGMVGVPEMVPWLIETMEAPDLARVAGEAFTMITGADFDRERLRGKPPEGHKSGPSDDPADPDVAPDPDENLPWPRLDAVKRWWGKHRGRFAAQTRHLAGKPVTQPWCEELLRQGYQRLREAAAIELALATPGKPLFAVRAPAARQLRLLSPGAS